MSNAAKNLLLSHPKIGQTEGTPVVTLAYKTRSEDSLSITEVEIPGVDPSTVDVVCESNYIVVSCAKGSVTIPLPSGTDAGKIEADIQWGVLTITAPQSEPPGPRSIKVGIRDAAPAKTARASKATKEFTDED